MTTLIANSGVLLSTNTNKKDIVIIGASLAGIVAAYLLGRAGYTVTIIDPQIFPRHKPCGEGLSSLGVSYLKAYGLWSPELEISSLPLSGYTITFNQNKHLTLQAPLGAPPPLHSISRSTLDSAVHNKVSNLATVTILNEKVAKIKKEASRWILKTEAASELSARELIVACGGRGVEHLLPGLAAFPASAPERYGIVYWCKGSWSGAAPSLVHIFQQDEGQYIITPLVNDSINVSILLNRQKNSSLRKQDILSKVAQFTASIGFRATTISPPLGASAIHSTRLKTPCMPVYCIGDTVERFDPIGGMGMTHAVFSAALAARTIISNNDAAVYYAHRSGGARTLRMLTGLSYGLNVSQSHWQKLIPSLSPTIAYSCLELIKQTFPSPPVVPTCSECLSKRSITIPEHLHGSILQEQHP